MILAIYGSAKRKGITAQMLDRAVASAEAKGITVNKIYLKDEGLLPCLGCRKCLETKECVQHDGIHYIAELVKQSDTVLLAAPVYWANVPAIVKNFFDRMLGVAMEETATFPKGLLKGKKYALFTACKTPAPFSWLCGQSKGAIRATHEFFATAGFKCLGNIVESSCDEKSEPSPSTLRAVDKLIKKIK